MILVTSVNHLVLQELQFPQYCLDFFLQPIKSNLQIVNSETPATSAVPPTKLNHIDICDT